MKKRRNQTIKEDENSKKDKKEVHSEEERRGVLPERDLKKNLGCGG